MPLEKDKYFYYYRTPEVLGELYMEEINKDISRFEKAVIWEFTPYCDMNNPTYHHAYNLQKLIKLGEANPRKYYLILPTRIIHWYKGSLTNLVKLLVKLHDVFTILADGVIISHVTLAQYLHDLKAEDTAIINYRRKQQGYSIGRPRKHFAVPRMIEQLLSGNSLKEIAESHGTCKQSVCNAIRRYVSENPNYEDGKKALKELEGRSKLLKKKGMKVSTNLKDKKEGKGKVEEKAKEI